MSAILLPDGSDLAGDIPDLNVGGDASVPIAGGEHPAEGRNDDVPEVDAEAAAEAAEEQANAIRPNAQGNPHEFVTMDSIVKSGPFLNMVVALPITLALVIALIVDAPRSCDTVDYNALANATNSSSSFVEDYGEPSPLKSWAITNVVLSGLMFVINAIATRIFVKNPASTFVIIIILTTFVFSLFTLLCLLLYNRTNGDRRWAMAIITSRILDVAWFVWFIVGAVWTFKLAKHPCVCFSVHSCHHSVFSVSHCCCYMLKQHYEIPFVYNVSMAIVIFGFTSLAAGLLACCVVCILLGMGLGALLRMRRHQGEEGPEEQASHGASDEQIAAMPIKTFYDGMIDAPEATCSICFGDYIPGEELRFLPCHHHFHAACVDTWFAGSKACPICKHPIDKPAPETTYNPTTPEGAAAVAVPVEGTAVAVPVVETATTTTTTTTTEDDSDELQQDEHEGEPFARQDSVGSPTSNMGTFVSMPPN